MLYICIPTHNEAATIGLLLWRIRKVFQEYSREYEVVVYDDGSTDATAETLASYAEVIPLTVIDGKRQRGLATALDACCRAVCARTRYPRRDALLFMQADFTDAPEQIGDLIRRFEGGADIVTAERRASAGMPRATRRLRALGGWVIGADRRRLGTTDPLSGFRVYRVSVIRDLVKTAGTKPLVSKRGSAANAELLVGAARFARRLESVPTTPRYDLRDRGSRARLTTSALAVFGLRKLRKERVRGAST